MVSLEKPGSVDSNLVSAHPIPELFLVYYSRSLEGSRVSCSTTVCQICIFGCPFQALETIQYEDYRTALGSIRNQCLSQPFVKSGPWQCRLFCGAAMLMVSAKTCKTSMAADCKTFASLGHGEGYNYMFAVSDWREGCCGAWAGCRRCIYNAPLLVH